MLEALNQAAGQGDVGQLEVQVVLEVQVIMQQMWKKSNFPIS